MATLAITSLLLSGLEMRWPYYFLQDDGLEYFLPSYFHNWRALLAGHLPLYDFHIFTGVPHLTMGQPGVFYIPEYVAMFLSNAIWGHPFATIDLMAFMHGLIAVAGGYVLLRYLGVADLAASFGALTALSGFFVWAGRMWPFVPMLCAWFPWMVWASLRYLEKTSAGRAGWLIFFRLGLLYGGQPQFFVLAMIFEHLFALTHSLASRRPGWKSRCGVYLALDVPTALLGLPFLLPVWDAVGRSLERAKPLSYAEFSRFSLHPLVWLFGQLFVFIQLRLPKNTFGGSVPYISHVGYIATLLSFAVESLWKKRTRSRPWIVASGVCFLIALLWCWNVLGPLIYRLPVLNRFRFPFKLIYFAGFFQCLLAALVLTLFSKRWQQVAVAGFAVNWIVVFCLLPNHAWRIRQHHPPLESPWQESLKDGRYFVISQGAVSSVSKQHVEFDYAELWGLDNLLGYEPLLSRLNARAAFGNSESEPDLQDGSYDGPVDQPLLDHLKKWSVKYVLVGPTRADASGKLAGAGFQLRTVKGGWTLWDDPNALPRVRWGGMQEGSGTVAGIRWVEHVNSIDVYLSQWPSQQLVFAFAANPGLETCVGKQCSAVGESPDGLIRTDVPAGTRHVRLVYHSAMLFPAIAVALATLLVYMLVLLHSLRSKGQELSGHAEYPMAASGREEP
ncbi:MAG: hypothetical protein M1404_04505 [Acidobacteria bacterium]|nr:hypothetical protein [Acidobacteriota bacterium]